MTILGGTTKKDRAVKNVHVHETRNKNPKSTAQITKENALKKSGLTCP